MIEIKTLAGELSDPQQSVMSAVLASGSRGGVVRDWSCVGVSRREQRLSCGATETDRIRL
jgi:hypothetical protein